MAPISSVRLLLEDIRWGVFYSNGGYIAVGASPVGEGTTTPVSRVDVFDLKDGERVTALCASDKLAVLPGQDTLALAYVASKNAIFAYDGNRRQVRVWVGVRVRVRVCVRSLHAIGIVGLHMLPAGSPEHRVTIVVSPVWCIHYNPVFLP